jgi:hypothetical protein
MQRFRLRRKSASVTISGSPRFARDDGVALIARELKLTLKRSKP